MGRLWVGAAACTTAYVAVFSVGDLDRHRGTMAAVVLPAWVVFVVATWWVRRGRGTLRRPVLAVVLLAAVVQVPGLCVPPRISSDAYRYVWDGRVQLSGTSPYRYAPLDDRLARLRDPILFPGLGPDERSGYVTQPVPTDRRALLEFSHNDPRTVINRPRVPTIYPPVAQAWFAAVAAVTPWSLGTLGLQVGSALLAIGVSALLAGWLVRRGRDPRGALWWSWCPVVAIEAPNGAHVDIFAAALVVLAVVAAGSRWRSRWAPVLTGVLLGLAAAVKLTPLVLLPAFTPIGRRGWWRSLPTPLVAVGTLAATYLPHVLVAGALVLGYLPGYVREEAGPNRSAALGLVLPDAAVTPVVVAVMAAVAGRVMWSARRQCPEQGALVLFGALLLLTTPVYPWYSLPLVALAVLTGRLEWLALGVAGHLAYILSDEPPATGLAYLGAAAVVLAVTLARRRRRPQARGTPALRSAPAR